MSLPHPNNQIVNTNVAWLDNMQTPLAIRFAPLPAPSPLPVPLLEANFSVCAAFPLRPLALR